MKKQKIIGQTRSLGEERHTSQGYTEEEVQNLWRTYKERGPDAVDARERLINHYSPYVASIVGKVGKGLPAHIGTDDLIQEGIIAMMDKLEDFDPSRGLKFEQYVTQRIRGVAIDYLRRIDPVPRTTRLRRKIVKRVVKHLTSEKGIPPAEEDVLNHLKSELGDRKSAELVLRDSTPVKTDNFSAMESDEYGSGREFHSDAKRAGIEQPHSSVMWKDSLELMSRRVCRTPLERLVYMLSYDESLTVEEIGQVAGISQRFTFKIMKSLSERIKAQGIEMFIGE